MRAPECRHTDCDRREPAPPRAFPTDDPRRTLPRHDRCEGPPRGCEGLSNVPTLRGSWLRRCPPRAVLPSAAVPPRLLYPALCGGAPHDRLADRPPACGPTRHGHVENVAGGRPDSVRSSGVVAGAAAARWNVGPSHLGAGIAPRGPGCLTRWLPLSVGQSVPCLFLEAGLRGPPLGTGAGPRLW